MAHIIINRKVKCNQCGADIELTDLDIVNAVTGRARTLTVEGRILKEHNCSAQDGKIVWVAF